MTIEHVHDIADSGESAQVEFKRTTGTLSAAAKTVCGILNGEGGYVLIGVRDDGSVLGQEVADRTRREVARELSKIEPQVVIEPEFVPVENDRVVIVLSVPGDREGPYTYDGRPYVRQGPTTQSMDRSTFSSSALSKIEILVADGKHVRLPVLTWATSTPRRLPGLLAQPSTVVELKSQERANRKISSADWDWPETGKS